MDAGDVPGEDPPLRVEAVREGAQTQVTRLYFPGRTVIRKQLLGPDAERRLRREVGILQRLRGVEGVTQLVDWPGRWPGCTGARYCTATSARPTSSSPATAPRPWSTSRWRPRWPSCAPGSPIPPRSSARWPT